MATTREQRRAARAAKKKEAADRQNRNQKDGALSTQVGGSHYISPLQHVEFCQVNRLPWCESAAIKYVLRHRKKNGKQDIQKAIHYLELLMALDYARIEEGEEMWDIQPKTFEIPLPKFIKANEVPELEATIITNICYHQVGGGDGGKDGLMDTIKLLEELLDGYEESDALSLLD